ncbi:hypothetical protein ACP26F_14565 [Franconibacter pulveris 1160]|uniref:hypothetical protein n=1 Tax=Enterobacteriaceae TaxID=543 RepID=UPI0004674AAA|nr:MULTISPECIES: hypothetical protein [Enterobacteriaceae]ELY2685041.1 hypothetical protein [Cronobacter sakazakii]ELY2759402.1 hypothetical protein [Cronobacter sakazakii]ELY4067157.1 hypothetical protein [Cronobacter sakazakii]ELY4847124.1 hypothetical protein [Cronobacter sakazakii]ELY7499753.1 hypothetical protein [Cronobacter sakazakii]
MAQTAPITEQLASDLLDLLEKGDTLGEMEAARKMRQAKNIDSPYFRIVVQALVTAAKGDREAAETQFKKYFSDFHSAVIGIGYAAYLFRIRKLSVYMDLCLRLVSEFPFDAEVIQKCIPMLYLSGNAKECKAKAKIGAGQMNNEKLAEEFRMVGEKWAANIVAAQDASGASEAELKELSKTVMEILEQYKSYAANFYYYPMASDGTAALVAITDVVDPEKIAEMNFDLAMAIADKDELQESRLTAWFECDKSERVNKEA